MKELSELLRDLEEDKFNELLDKQIEANVPVMEIIEDCNQGMVAVGELFSLKKYYISQLMFSAEILRGAMKKLEPLLVGKETEGSKNKVIIGTVKGDIHDIGKNIVATLLRGAGFEVIDLGVDVPAHRFVDMIKESGAKAVGMSALLNFTYPEMKAVVDAIIDAGLRDQVKIMIGGAPVNEQVRAYSGADYFATDAVAGVGICKEIYA